MTKRQRRASRAEGVTRRISPVAASQGSVVAQANKRCTCGTVFAGRLFENPACSVHGRGEGRS